MAEIRVDQSHCNRHTARYLSSNLWTILFTDPGRVSRGGIGSQGKSLRIFEEGGLPIPDIVAVHGKCLLLIEVDSTVVKVISSLEIYLKYQQSLLEKFGSVCKELGMAIVEEIRIGFCKTGIVKSADNFFLKNKNLYSLIDVWVAFEAPQEPLFYWVKGDCD